MLARRCRIDDGCCGKTSVQQLQGRFRDTLAQQRTDRCVLHATWMGSTFTRQCLDQVSSDGLHLTVGDYASACLHARICNCLFSFLHSSTSCMLCWGVPVASAGRVDPVNPSAIGQLLRSVCCCMPGVPSTTRLCLSPGIPAVLPQGRGVVPLHRGPRAPYSTCALMPVAPIVTQPNQSSRVWFQSPHTHISQRCKEHTRHAPESNLARWR